MIPDTAVMPIRTVAFLLFHCQWINSVSLRLTDSYPPIPFHLPAVVEIFREETSSIASCEGLIYWAADTILGIMLLSSLVGEFNILRQSLRKSLPENPAVYGMTSACSSDGLVPLSMPYSCRNPYKMSTRSISVGTPISIRLWKEKGLLAFKILLGSLSNDSSVQAPNTIILLDSLHDSSRSPQSQSTAFCIFSSSCFPALDASTSK
mmetsp:Transcript_40929/g.65772  ORF Transcript_40929/g.65772 Transcript_40929/m.65772 type:complete len:207 (-) Transcript_40929:1734-2354(-)